MTPSTIAFKEWAIICQLLLQGRQALILRKGGIAEGREGFAFSHDQFYLMPTRFHEQILQTRLPSDTPIPPPPPENQIIIEARATILRTCVLTRWEQVDALAPLHFWSEPTIRQRFAADATPGISVALVRIERLTPAHRFADHRRYGGCRSWVEIPPPAPSTQFEPVLPDPVLQALRTHFDQLLKAG